jgi:DeoR family L-fucose operon activator
MVFNIKFSFIFVYFKFFCIFFSQNKYLSKVGVPVLHSLERLHGIEKTINERGIVRVSELSELFNVTEVTIRSDLSKLESEGKLIRNHGGAASLSLMKSGSRSEPINPIKSHNEEQLTPYELRKSRFKKEKIQIARAALDLIQPYDRIILDASSTAFYLAQMIPTDLPVTVLTNSVNIIVELNKKQKTEVISTGGILSKNSMSFIGPVSEGTLGMYNVNKAFLSCMGLHFETGITDSNELQVLVKKKMIQVTEQVILLADHSKFGLKSFVHLTNFDQIHMIITDSNIELQHQESMNHLGIRYRLAH